MGRRIPNGKYLVAALVLVLANIFTIFHAPKAHAIAQATSRSITMSTSQPGATNVTYAVSFKPATVTSLKGIVIDFCDNSPTFGNSTCSTTNLGAFTVTTTPTFTSVAVGTATALPGSWTSAGANTFGSSQFRTVKLTSAAGSGALTVGTSYSFTISAATMTNPSLIATPTFYARIITYSTSGTDFTNYAPGNENPGGQAVDYGGVALSIASVISITARVAEALQFCVASAAITTACANAAANPPNVNLGQGAQYELSTSVVSTIPVYMQASTNAVSGVTVAMRNITGGTCGGMSRNAGTTCDIPATNSGGSTAAAMPAGTAAFGMYNTTGTSLIGALAPIAPYNGGTTNYAMDTTSASNILTTFGDQIASSTGPLSSANNILTFAATASAVTPAGIYTANIVLVCTGLF
jgi:hypothetical protein